MIDRPEMPQYLEAALRGAALRQSIIANNIANANTPGYRRSDVAFEKLLADAIASGKAPDLDKIQDLVLRPQNTEINDKGNDVDMDMEVGGMIKNTEMYKTYMRMLGRVYRKMELAIQD